jgi:ABC-2 type transport system permease protein
VKLEASAKLARSRFAMNLATVRVLAGRDLVRFFRQRSRVIGALVQPILFWFVIGSGFSGSFRMPGAEKVSYMQFFYPGVLTMVLLFSTIFATITLIDDRREGFLQSVLAGPGSRMAVVVGKSAGCSAIAILQACLFLLLAPLAQVHWGTVDWPLLGVVMVLTSLALTGVGFTMAWWINSSTGYHAVMSVILIPSWVLSGAMFPMKGAGPILSIIIRVNPMRFAVDGVRRALYGSEAVAEAGQAFSGGELIALLLFAAAAIGAAAWRVSRRE